MSEYRDMALDAGYRGEEADQAARMLEEQEREKYERLEADRYAQMQADHDAEMEAQARALSGLPPICERCGAPVIVYDALVDRMVTHDCQPKPDGKDLTE